MCIVADERKMTRYSYAMIHELSAGLGRTNYTRILTHAECVEKLHNNLIRIYQERRNIDYNDTSKMEELEKLLIRETWMTAEEYMAYKFVDEK